MHVDRHRHQQQTHRAGDIEPNLASDRWNEIKIVGFAVPHLNLGRSFPRLIVRKISAVFGQGAFDAATSWRIDLRHEIRPRGGTPFREPLPVDTLPLAPSDFRDILPDEPVHTLYDGGERFHMTGRVTATDHDFYYITIELFRDPGGDGNEIARGTYMSSNGSFEVAMPTFTANQRGQWMVVMYLYWPGAPRQYPRLELGTLTVR